MKQQANQQVDLVPPMQVFTPPIHIRKGAADPDILLHPAPHPLRDAVFQQLQLLHAPVCHARNLKLSAKTLNADGFKRTEVPSILLCGKWMHEAGFTQMGRFFLYAYDGMIILVPQGPPPPPAARKSWYGLPGIGRKRKKTAAEIKMDQLSEKLSGRQFAHRTK